jgi:fumarate reductase subunit C
MCPIFIETYSRYLDYYLLTPKVVITLTRRAKLIDIRAILNTRVEVSIIILNTTIYFKILITYSLRIALRTITSNKSRFIRFIDNILVIIRNLVV